MKRALKSILHSTLLLGSVAGIVITGSIPLSLLLIPTGIISAARLSDDISGNEINNSIFSVSSNGKIAQNSLGKPIRTLKAIFSKNKNELFMNESINMFTGLKTRNNSGNKINYSTVSHAKTISLLKKLENNGYVENLNYEKKKKSRLFLARLLIGNTNNLNKNKKVQMYDINFNLTDKERKKEELTKLINSSFEKKEEKNTQEPIIEKNKINENSEIREKIRNLEYQKEELINSQFDNHEQKRHHM